MDIVSLYEKFKKCQQKISTDTRLIESGSIFFAWKGEHQDGNEFAYEALEKGAKYVVVDNHDIKYDARFIYVKNSQKTLQDLARHHRKQFSIPIIAIAGSNGKTTTKELIYRVLSTQKNIIASLGSLNNHVGVPLSILRITNHTDAAVIELGANHIGEIADLCSIAMPTHGLITNIGRDHIGIFGGEGAIIESNLELYRWLESHTGTIFVHKENTILMKYAKGIKQICYGSKSDGPMSLQSLNTSPLISIKWHSKKITTQLTGEYNCENIAAAIAVGVHFNITRNNIISAIAGYSPTGNRSQISETEKDNIVIRDFYNANRTSMEHALQNLADIGKKYPQKKTLAILGDMFELGDYSLQDHQYIVDTSCELSIDQILLVGSNFAQTQHDNIQSFSTVDDIINYLQNQNIGDSSILLKASNGMNFQKIFNEVHW